MPYRCKYGALHDTADAPGYECVHCEIERLQAELAACRDKALRYDLDQAGIASREAESVELVELRAELAECRKSLETIERWDMEIMHTWCPDCDNECKRKKICLYPPRSRIGKLAQQTLAAHKGEEEV
jgi:hypothetical protein